MKMSFRIAQNLLEMVGQGLWGFKPNLMQHIVEQHGAISSLSWFVKNMPKYEKILKQWGAIRTHLLASEISVLNGCPYCTYGHVYALQLHYFKANGRLMPADENEVMSWHTASEDDAIERFRQLIHSSELMSELPILERMLLLRQGVEPPTSEDDLKIAHFLQMFGFLNRCGIKGKTGHDQAHDPINKDISLRNEYSRLRQESAQRQDVDRPAETNRV
jgi:hypothetical protein